MGKEARKARIRLPVEVKIRKLTLESRWKNSNFRKQAHVLGWLPSDVQICVFSVDFPIISTFFFFSMQDERLLLSVVFKWLWLSEWEKTLRCWLMGYEVHSRIVKHF